MKMRIEPGPLSGTVRAISSKSAAHRCLICAALCDEPSELLITDRSADIDATMGCLEAMGAEIRREDDGAAGQEDGKTAGSCGWYRVSPVARGRENVILDCGESGSTLRFLVPVAAAVCKSAEARGRGRLPMRPLDHLTRVMASRGAVFSAPGGNAPDRQNQSGRQNQPDQQVQPSLPLQIAGALTSGVYEIAGNISSQYISGLLFALPMLSGDSRIVLTSELESVAYVEMTLAALARYGIKIEKENGGFFVPGGQHYRAQGPVKVEGDWSNAAFFLAAGAMGGTGITCTGLDLRSVQGDKAVLGVLRAFGAKVDEAADEETADGGTSSIAVGSDAKPLSGIELDVSQIPDLMPVLAVTACAAKGKTVFRNAGRLRIKESDRIAAVAALINALGGDAEEGPDSLTVFGTGRLRGGCADSFGDHRIAMSAAVAAVICEEPVTVVGAEAVEKSYPAFYEHYRQLGGRADVI